MASTLMCKNICSLLHCDNNELLCYIVCQFVKDCYTFVNACDHVTLNDFVFGVVHGQYVECTLTPKSEVDVMPELWKYFENNAHIGFYHGERNTVALRLALSKIVCNYDKIYT